MYSIWLYSKTFPFVKNKLSDVNKVTKYEHLGEAHFQSSSKKYQGLKL